MPVSMLALDPSELLQQQVDFTAVMPNTCNITRPGVPAQDAGGGAIEGYVAVASAVICSVYPARALSSLAQDIQQNDEGKVIGEWIINLPYGTVVMRRDRIKVIETGRLYEAITDDDGAVYTPIVAVKATLIE